MKATMPGTMYGILGGYRKSLESSDRVAMCHLADQPQGFAEALFPLYMRDDDALLRASHAHWILTPAIGAWGCRRHRVGGEGGCASQGSEEGGLVVWLGTDSGIKAI